MRMKIETERLIIRDYNVNDFNDYYDYIMEPELQRMLGLEEVTDKTSAYRNFEWLINNRTFFAIEEKSTTKAIGHICLHPPYSALSESEEFKGRVGYSISYAISTDRRRKGYMEEALRNLINSMFQSSEADYFDCEYPVFNEASRALQEKIGFKFWGKEHLEDLELVINVLKDEERYNSQRNIIRINSYEDFRFSRNVLNQHGAYIIDGEPYEVEIVDSTTAVVRGKDISAYLDLIEEFRFNAPQITRFYNSDNKLISEFKQEQFVTIKIEDIQPSQFFIDKTKLEAVKTFIHEPDDIVIQAKPWNDRYISLDGHTRLYLAVEKGYKTVKAIISESDDWVWPFVEEAAKRGITTPKDMQLLPHDQYEIQWNQYCNSIFENDNN